MPREKTTRSKRNSTNESDEYWCTCLEKCGGVRHKLSRTTWYKHNPQRKETAENAQLQRAMQAEARLEGEVARQIRKDRARSLKKGKGKDIEGVPAPAVSDFLSTLSMVLTPLQDKTHSPSGEAGATSSSGPHERSPDITPFDSGGPHNDEHPFEPMQGDFNAVGAGEPSMNMNPPEDGEYSRSRTPSPPPYTPENEPQNQTNGDELEEQQPFVEICFDIPGGDSNTTMDKLCKIGLQYINRLQNASLEDSGLSENDLYAIQNPRSRIVPDLDQDLGLKLMMKHFVGFQNAPKNLFESARKAAMETFPDHRFPSYNEVESLVRRISGAAPLFHDMCPSHSCVAFTGPFENLDECPECGAPRWKDPTARKKVARKQALTLPIGPSIQALYAGKESSLAMQYRMDKTREILAAFASSNGSPLHANVLDDIFSGDWYLKATHDGSIDAADTLLMFSIDGAQLYRHRQSDVWLYIWVIMDLAPDKRYKKRYVLPGGIIPGPEKPKILDTFLFPGLYHIAALQQRPGNLPIYDASKDEDRSTCPHIILATADTLGMTTISGTTGHTGAKGCRKSCGQKGRHYHGKGTYYPVLKLPYNYRVVGCDFPDIQLATRPPPSQRYYNEAMNTIIHTRAGAPHDRVKKATGFTRPTIFNGVPSPYGVPGLFPLDCMHLFALNIPELLLSLWRCQTKVVQCHPNDNKSTWEWVCLVDDVWTEHGSKVASLRKYLPPSYERPPRNPAEKISSGYKASEFLTYVYGYLPILLPGILPEPYLTHFYKLVRAIRLFSQNSISRSELDEGRRLTNEFVEEFEDHYAQRSPYRLHFIRPCLHALSHVADEISNLGPLRCYAQWTIERMIGILESNLRLHSNPFSNLEQIAFRQVAVTGLISRMPELDNAEPEHVEPNWSFPAGHGYRLLHPHDPHLMRMTSGEAAAFSAFFSGSFEAVFVRRSTRLQIPGVHTTRSRLREVNSGIEHKTTSRIVKVS